MFLEYFKVLVLVYMLCLHFTVFVINKEQILCEAKMFIKTIFLSDFCITINESLRFKSIIRAIRVHNILFTRSVLQL